MKSFNEYGENMGKQIYLSDKEIVYLRSLLEAQDDPEFTEHQEAKTPLGRKIS